MGEVKLTATMKWHLVELLTAPYWTPIDSGERSVARALERRGYLDRDPSRGTPDYALTEAGRKRARAVADEGEPNG